MNNTKFLLNNLAISNLSCNDATIYLGSTYTAPWGYIFKLDNVYSISKEAIVTLLYNGDFVETKLMKINDTFSLTDPSNSEGRFDIILKNVHTTKETKAAFVSGCTYIKQYSTLTMITDLPTSVVDGQSYTVSGRLTKDRLNETLETPITNEKVYIKESGTKIVETPTDSDGVFSLTFTYHINNNYEIYYPGTVDVNSITKMLNATTVPGSTHRMSITFNKELPDYAITAFNSISNPVESIIQKLNENGTINDITGWELKDVQINKKQIIVYLRDMNIQTLSNIKTLDVGDIITKILAGAVVGASIGMIAGVIFPPAEPFTITAGVILGVLTAIFSQWKAVISFIVSIPGYIKDAIFGTGEEEPTRGDVDEDVNKNKDLLDSNCKKTYDECISSDENTKTCCLNYCDCLYNNGYVTIAGTKVYLNPLAGADLRKLAEQLRSDAKNECINKLEKDEISCDDAIECIKTRVSNAMISSTEIIKTYYNLDDTYKPPWEKDDNKGIFGNLLFYGGLALAGYVGYKILTKPK